MEEVAQVVVVPMQVVLMQVDMVVVLEAVKEVPTEGITLERMSKFLNFVVIMSLKPKRHYIQLYEVDAQKKPTIFVVI